MNYSLQYYSKEKHNYGEKFQERPATELNLGKYKYIYGSACYCKKRKTERTLKYCISSKAGVYNSNLMAGQIFLSNP